jgi:hypothetical protein
MGMLDILIEVNIYYLATHVFGISCKIWFENCLLVHEKMIQKNWNTLILFNRFSQFREAISIHS